MRGTERSRGRGKCGWDIIYVNNKNKKIKSENL